MNNAHNRVGHEEFLSVVEAAKLLGVSRNSLDEAVAHGKIPHNRIGKRIVFSRSALISWAGASRKP